MANDTAGGRRGMDLRLAGLIVMAMALLLLVTPIPLLIDLPSHIARYHVERDLSSNPSLALNFTYHWRFIPNLGIDLIVASLGRLIGVEPAARVAVALIPAVGAIGMLLVGQALHGRLTIGTLLALTLNYSYPLVFGFVNSCFALSLAFVAFGAWLMIGAGRPGVRALFAAVAAPVVLTAHIVGYGALGLMVLGAAIAEQTALRRSPRAGLFGVLRATLPFAWPFVLLLLWQTGGTATNARWFEWRQIAMWLAMVVREQFAAIDIVSAMILYAALLLPVIARRRFEAASAAVYAAGLLWLAVIVLPGRLFGSEFASVRLIPVALAVSLLAVRERSTPRPPLMRAGAAFVAFRLGISTLSLMSSSAWGARELGALTAIRPGSRVAAVTIVPCARVWNPPRSNHLQSYATIRRDAFVNGQFAATEGQALGLQPRIDPELALLPTTGTIERCPRFEQQQALSSTLAALPWAGIDYLWLIDAGTIAIAVPADAHIVWRNAHSRLYVIEHR